MTQNEKRLYCICYERIFGTGTIVARTSYLHAESDSDARFKFLDGAPQGFILGVHFRIVSVAPAIGAYYEKGSEDKQNSIAEIE